MSTRYASLLLPFVAMVVHCATAPVPACTDARVIFTGEVQPGATLVVTDDKGATLSPLMASARVSFERGSNTQYVRVDLPNVSADPASTRYIQFEFPAGPDALAVKANTVITTPNLRTFVYGAGCSQTGTIANTTAQMLGVRGTVDPIAKKVDGNFWRRIAVDVDWSGVGCTVSSVRGRVVFDVTPASNKIEMACDSDKFAIVGAVEAPPADGITPDASTPDASTPDASTPDASK